MKKPRSEERGFLAPPVGLEPTTCGLTEHESKSQKASQAIKKRGLCFVFGDLLPTDFSKQVFAKMPSQGLALTFFPMSHGKLPYTGTLTGKTLRRN